MLDNDKPSPIGKASVSSGKKSGEKADLQFQLNSSFFTKKLGDSYKTHKGNSSIVIRDFKMLINSVDNQLSLYNMNNITETLP